MPSVVADHYVKPLSDATSQSKDTDVCAMINFAGRENSSTCTVVARAGRTKTICM